MNRYAAPTPSATSMQAGTNKVTATKTVISSGVTVSIVYALRLNCESTVSPRNLNLPFFPCSYQTQINWITVSTAIAPSAT